MKIVIQKINNFYPNPFIDTVNLKFSEKINEEITISILIFWVEFVQKKEF
jgi:hypothetical protein